MSEFGRSNKCHLHLSGYILNLRPSTFCISVTILSLIDCRIDPIFKEELFSVVNWGAQVSEFISFEVHLKGPTAPIDPLRSLDISLSLKLTFYHKILTGNFLSLWSFFSSIFSNAVLLINNNPTENIDHHHYWHYHRGLMCAGLIRHSISVLSLLLLFLLLLPNATYCLPPTYLHSLQAGYEQYCSYIWVVLTQL